VVEQLTIRQVLPLNKGEWYISYTHLAQCKCRIQRDKLKMYQTKKPTNKQITNAINNQEREMRADLGD